MTDSFEIGSTCYTQETPSWLWRLFTNGPADDYRRYSDRINILIAADVLTNCREELTDDQAQELRARIADLDALEVNDAV